MRPTRWPALLGGGMAAVLALGSTFGHAESAMPRIMAAGPWHQAATDGPDLARRSAEDAAIEAADDEIARAEARLDAAAAALRLDLPPRARTRLWWTPVDADLASAATEAAARANDLAGRTFTDLLTSSHAAVDRLQARATVIRAVATALADRAAATSTGDWTSRLRRLHSDAGDGADRTSQLDGPTLLALAAAALADPNADADAARTLLERAGTVPEGLDALEYALVEALVEAGGIDVNRRRETTRTLLEAPRPAADRLLLGSVHLDALIESGRPPEAAIGEAIRVMLPGRGVDADDRTRIVRAFADVAAATVATDASIESLPPIVAFRRLVGVNAAADPETMRSERTDALLVRAVESTSPDVRAEAWLEAATLRMRRGEANAALEAMLQAIEASPRHPRAAAAATLAVRLVERMDDDAIVDAALERLVATQADHPQRHRWNLLRGDRAIAAGDRSAAREAWTRIPESADVGVEGSLRVLRLDADRIDARGASNVLQALDRLDARIPADASDPRRVDADLLRLRALLTLERTTSAAEIAARFIDPTPVPASFRAEVAALAVPALDSAGRRDDADRLRAGLEALDPTLASRSSSDRLRKSYDQVMGAIDRDDRVEAGSLARTSLGSAPVSVETLAADAGQRADAAVKSAWVLAAAGRLDDARRVAEAVVAAHPAAIEGLYLLAVLDGGRLAAPARVRPAPDETAAAAAVRTLSRINAGSARGSNWWWRSEIEKLEILAALGRDLARIDARLERLETEFADLGGPAFEQRIRTLRAAISSARIRG